MINEAYWRILKSDKDFLCQQNQEHLIKTGNIHFQIQIGRSFPYVCIDCFIAYANQQIGLLKGEINSWNNIISKLEMKKEKDNDNSTDGKKQDK